MKYIILPLLALNFIGCAGAQKKNETKESIYKDKEFEIYMNGHGYLSFRIGKSYSFMAAIEGKKLVKDLDKAMEWDNQLQAKKSKEQIKKEINTYSMGGDLSTTFTYKDKLSILVICFKEERYRLLDNWECESLSMKQAKELKATLENEKEILAKIDARIKAADSLK